jgi:DNA-binding NarL/FixJ family response regulator
MTDTMEIQLTQEEKKLVHFIAQGITVKEMTLLYLPNKRTIEKRIEALLKKLNCKNRNELVYKCTKAGAI